MYELRAFLSIETGRPKWPLVKMALLAALVGMLELAAVALIVPAMAVISDPSGVAHLPVFGTSARALSEMPWRQALITVMALLVFTYVLKNGVQSYYYRYQTELAARWQSDLASRLMKLYLGAPYQSHLQRHSSELIRNMTIAVQQFYGDFLNAIFSLVSDCTAAFALIVVLLVVAPGPALLGGALMVSIYAAQYYVFRRVHARLGHENIDLRRRMQLNLQQGLGAIKEVRVAGREVFFLQSFLSIQELLGSNIARFEFARRLPPVAGEAAIISCMSVAVLVLLYVVSEPSHVLGALGVLAAAAFRLSPLANRIVGATAVMHNARASLVVITKELESFGVLALGHAIDGQRVSFQREIELRNVKFCYPGRSQAALEDISLVVRSGEVVGVIGSSGAGKTTLIDILLGLFVPMEGAILVDGSVIRGRLNAGYVAQDVFVLDDSLRRNIAFGRPDQEIDEARVGEVVRLASLDRFVSQLPQGLDTELGERGSSLSGGQRQRVGIARALYPRPTLLVLDEATSAVDAKTEEQITGAIAELRRSVTMIIIAHRLGTVRNCDRLILLNDGRIAEQGTFEELHDRSSDFRSMVRAASLGRSDFLPESA
ncbi:MAG TPA: ABC transporter ATP-binding protein [Bryobacteraceae bacterium]|nr:ABC transporter ATP-binding protein [Bryobacteraceae bacterium]